MKKIDIKKYDKSLMSLAVIWSKESHCKRLKVGAILAIGGRSIMSGYNGMPMRYKTNVCETVDYATKHQVIHAEMNAILFCAKQGIATEGSTLYVTVNPCSACAASIYHAGIKRVVYKDFYRDRSGIEELEDYGIRVDHLT